MCESWKRCLVGVVVAVAFASSSRAELLYSTGVPYAPYPNSWPTNWTELTGLNDGVATHTNAYVDFVGSPTSPGAYMANQDGYVFFRFRVAADSIASSSQVNGSLMVLVDRVGVGKNIDYAFAWDAKNGTDVDHGLEMMVGPTDTTAMTWSSVSMADRDGNSGQKLWDDINGFPGSQNVDQRTGEGYVQSVNGLSTSDLGVTSFVDFAVKWDYLNNHTDLRQADAWRLALGSIDNANDHNVLNADIAGGASLTDPVSSTGWSNAIQPSAVPEPSTVLLLSVGLAGLGVRQWRRRKSGADATHAGA